MHYQSSAPLKGPWVALDPTQRQHGLYFEEENRMNTLPRSVHSHLWLVVTLLALGMLLTSSATSALARPGQQPIRSARSGGMIAYRDGAPVSCVDPLIAPTTVEGLIDYATMDNLVLLDGKGVARPDLATHWTYSHGGKWVTFYLRK